MNSTVKNKLSDMLYNGLQQLGEEPGRHPCERYLAFVDLLHEWNRAYNLTGVRNREEILIRHVLDSLTALPFIQGRECLDVATGAGLPGFILALGQPSRQWTLLDSSIKKIRFLNQAVLELKPDNVKIVRSRIEDFEPRYLFDTVITRAYTTLKEFHHNTVSLLNKNGKLIAMKGRKPESELNEMLKENIDMNIHEIIFQASDIVRHIIVMRN